MFILENLERLNLRYTEEPFPMGTAGEFSYDLSAYETEEGERCIRSPSALGTSESGNIQIGTTKIIIRHAKKRTMIFWINDSILSLILSDLPSD